MRNPTVRLAAAVVFTLGAASAADGQTRPPIIDVHVHSLWWDPGGPDDPANPRAKSSDELRERTLGAFKRYNIVAAVTDGPEANTWAAAMPGTIIPAWGFFGQIDKNAPLDSVRQWFRSGRYKVMAESAPQYEGIGPADPILEPYYELAEELDVPVGIHIGLGQPGAAYTGDPKYRMSLSNPLALEDVLIRHPKMRLYVMHAGWPMGDEMIGLLYAHPQVYVDIGIIDWAYDAPPGKEGFYDYLQKMVRSGFGKRIMFGSDQMVWPDAIGRAIAAIQGAPFLSEEQKRDILYNNAARFLKLTK